MSEIPEDLQAYIRDGRSAHCTVCGDDALVVVGRLTNGRLATRCPRHARVFVRLLMIAQAVEGDLGEVLGLEPAGGVH
jgi:hypothetical protein